MASKPTRRGRPPLGKGKGRDSTQVTARVTREERRKIDRYCLRRGISVSEMIRTRLADVMCSD